APPVLEEASLAVEETFEVGRGTGNPVVGESCRALEGDIPPAADPDGRVGLRDRLGLEAPVDGVVRPLEADPLLRPERLDDRELLLEPRPALLECHPVQAELVGLVADSDAHGEA